MSQHTCPFCREAVPQTKKECEQLNIKRAEANDPVAIFQLGAEEYKKGDYRGAIEYFTRAAELGIAEAHYELSHMYLEGQGVEKVRERKYTIWKKLLLAVIRLLDSDLEFTRREMKIIREQ